MDNTTPRLELPARPASAGEARRFVSDVLRGLGVETDDVIEAALLLTSELVTNAVLYAAGTIAVGVDLAMHGVRVEVCDDSQDPPTPREAAPDDLTGRGLHLVDALARDWGVARQPDDGKVVWFELDAGAEAVGG